MNSETTIKFNGQEIKLTPRDEVDASVTSEIFRYREYRSAENIIKSLDKNGVILDVGAHVGIFTLYARALNSQPKIYCLEPEPHNFTQLKKHLTRNHTKNIYPKMVALAATTSKGQLQIMPDNHNHQLLSEPVVIPAPISIGINSGKILNLDTKTITVPTVSLADFCYQQDINTIDLLKMDIEGAEYEIFTSLKPVDFSLLKNIILEYHNYHDHNYREIETLLRQQGFGVQIFPSQFDHELGFILATSRRVAK